jgi:phage terminase large subunit-like protein
MLDADTEFDPEEALIMRELIDRGGLHEFVRQFWGVTDPRDFLDNWHLEAICEYLTAVTLGEVKRLVINIPPGHSKSKMVGVFWPAWFWTLDPGCSFLAGSFDQSLLNNQSEQMISILNDARYKTAYPYVKLRKEAPALREFKNSRGGFRFNTSPEGKGTGRHVDGIIIDDPLKPQDAILGREAAFKKVDAWFDGTLQTRVKRWIVVVMQRVHSNDLAGRCIAEGYESLVLPARQVKRSMWARDPRKEVGELLWPELFPEERVRAQEIKLKNEASAQLQQDPTPATGGFVEESWTRLEWISAPTKGTFVQSWDFSSKGTKESHSKVAGELWCVTRDLAEVREYFSSLADRMARVPNTQNDYIVRKLEGRPEMYCLIDWVGGHWNYVASKAQFTLAQSRPHWHRAKIKLIELKANGPAIIEEMQSKFPGIKGVEPQGSKEERYHVHTEKWESGQVVYPPGDSRKVDKIEYIIGADVVREEHIKFPRFTHDDHVDTTTQALDRLADKSRRYRENLAKIANRR